ncbi:MAG: two-component regulator propeller domain-containing protein [Blastocatellia bacterium]
MKSKLLIIKLTFLTICFLVLFSEKLALAQQLPYRTYTTSDGLAENTILKIIQDKKGRLWFGTKGGLSIYDGVRFTNYSKEDGLAGMRVYDIYQESENIFWLAMEEGISKIEFKESKAVIKSFTDKQGVSSKSFFAVLPDNNNFLFAGEDGLFIYDGKSFENITNKYQLPKQFRCAIKDKEGNFWLGGNNLIKLNLTNKTTTIYEEKDGLLPGRIRDIYQDKFGDIWIASTENGIARFLEDENKFQYFNTKNGLPSNTCFSITSDHLGNYWVGTNQGAIKFFFSKNTTSIENLSYYKVDNGLPNNIILPIFIDKESTIWFGSHNGLSKLTSEKFINYTDKDGLIANKVNCTLQDKDGDIWIATELGVNILSNGKLINLSDLQPNLSKERANVLVQDKTGLIWVSHYSNIAAYRKRKQADKISIELVKVLDKNIGLSEDPAYCLLVDDLGQLWIGTNEGLIIYNDKAVKIYTKADGLSSNKIYNLNKTSDNQIWAGTEDGATLISILPDGSLTFKSFQESSGLKAKAVGYIIKDKKNTTWISTEGNGLYKWDGEKFSSLSVANGLSNNVIHWIYEDNDGAIWVATNNGIDKLTNGKIQHYNYKDGFSQKASATQHIMVDKEGNFWFSTTMGLTRYNPRLDQNSLVNPGLEITNIKVGQKASAYQDYQSLITGQTISFEHNKNSLEIDFVALSFVDEERNSYKYQLKSVNSLEETAWSSTNVGNAQYSSLASGDYLFSVKAINPSGIESEVKTIAFRIEKPFWLQSWFLLTSSFLLTISVYGTYRLRVRVIEAKNQRLETIVRERTNEILEQKNQLEEKNQELKGKNEELILSQQRADRIFSALAETLPGTILDGKYQLGEKIGAGGFGAVYRGTHLIMKRPIAIKVFRPIAGNDSVEALERFQLEAISASKITHTNAIAVLDSGVSSEGIAYQVMELLKGHSLKEELKRKKALSLGRALEILLPVCDVLSKAHNLGIIHRDIKPDNIFLHQTPEGEVVKLLDFGIAKLMGPSEGLDVKALTATGRIIGTPAYMAPERFEGKGDIHADVYSLGVVLYEMLTGEVPFQEHLDNIYVWLGVILTKEPEKLSVLNPIISQEVESVIMQTISKDRNKRPTAKELAEKLLMTINVDPVFASSLGQLSEQLQKVKEIWQAPKITKLSNLEAETLITNANSEAETMISTQTATLISGIDDKETATFVNTITNKENR